MKKILSCLLIFSVLFSLCSPVFAGPGPHGRKPRHRTLQPYQQNRRAQTRLDVKRDASPFWVIDFKRQLSDKLERQRMVSISSSKNEEWVLSSSSQSHKNPLQPYGRWSGVDLQPQEEEPFIASKEAADAFLNWKKTNLGYTVDDYCTQLALQSLSFVAERSVISQADYNSLMFISGLPAWSVTGWLFYKAYLPRGFTICSVAERFSRCPQNHRHPR